MSELPKAYDPLEVEPRWYAFWEQQGIFRASREPDDRRPAYVIPMPRPNGTGSVAIGHAVCACPDVISRHARVRGFNALWQAGSVHAGISTQVGVERQLRREGKARHGLCRDAFVERVWRWNEQRGG